MTAAPAKFAFDLDFSHAPQKKQALSEAEIERVRAEAAAEAYQRGLAEGRTTAEAKAADALAKAAERLANDMAATLKKTDAMRADYAREAIGLAKVVGQKFAAHLIARQPAAELEALFTDCLASLDKAPHIVVRCHPDLADLIKQKAGAAIARSGFEGRLIVLGDPDIRIGDGRIEWAEGGVVRDISTAATEIDRRIADYLAALGPAEPRKAAS